MIIGISGSSGSGKSFVVKYLIDNLPKDLISIVYQDNYYKKRGDQEKDTNGEYNFDLPTSFINEDLIADIKALRKGVSISRDEYNFNNPKIISNKIIVNPKPIIILEGLFLFNLPSLSKILDRKIFIDCETNLMIERRIKRDTKIRGYDKYDVLYKYENHVIPAYHKYILPYKKDVDLVIDNNKNDLSGAISALNYIKKEYDQKNN
tara:strand:- start:769 stop:1386 length:618 start_codon:yes stop_codon:yes gene_type:complete